MTGGRLHRDIRHPSSSPLRLSFSSLSSTRRHAAFRNVTPVTDCRYGARDNNNCQRSNVSRVGYGQEEEEEEEREAAILERERERELKSARERGERGG